MAEDLPLLAGGGWRASTAARSVGSPAATELRLRRSAAPSQRSVGGVYWGEDGWFRLAKGIDNLGVESQECSWATPKKTW